VWPTFRFLGPPSLQRPLARIFTKHTMSQLLRSLFTGSALLIALSAYGAVIYRWVDESGRTHVSDVVPEKYRKSATRTDSSSSQVSPEQRQQAERAAARNAALAEEAGTRRQSPTPNQPSTAASQPDALKRPTQGITDSTDCQTWRRLYLESTQCFAPFRTANGSTKAEAFEKCNPIPSPELKCGPVRD
jgi:hypothetical protein